MLENISSRREKYWRIVLKNIRSSNKIKPESQSQKDGGAENIKQHRGFMLRKTVPELPPQTFSPPFHLQSLSSSSDYLLNWYRKNLSISMPLSPAGLPHVAGYQGNKDSAVCFYGEQIQTSRLPTLRSLIHVERLRISDSSTKPSISSLSAVFFIPIQSIPRMTWEVNNSDGWVPIAALWWQCTTNPTPEKSRSAPVKLSARIQS